MKLRIFMSADKIERYLGKDTIIADSLNSYPKYKQNYEERQKYSRQDRENSKVI